MPGSISRSYRPPLPAEDSFTWTAELGPEWYKIANIERLFLMAREDGVPSDATVQMSGDRLYIHWTRKA